MISPASASNVAASSFAIASMLRAPSMRCRISTAIFVGLEHALRAEKEPLPAAFVEAQADTAGQAWHNSRDVGAPYLDIHAAGLSRS